MSKKIFVAMAVVLLLLSALPYGAYGEATTPYIEIQYPHEGQTVGKTTELVVVAEGNDLRNPFVSIEGANGIAVGFPLEGCIYTAPGYADLTNEELSTMPVPVGSMKMYCKTEINLGAFEGQKIKLSANVLDGNQVLIDSVGLFVSGQCA